MPITSISPANHSTGLHKITIAACGFNRPECVLALANGDLIASHGAGGYSVLNSKGELRHVLIRSDDGRKYVPNGIALAPDGRVLFADLGAEAGGIFAINADGSLEALVTELNGQALPPSNFVVVDHRDVLWFTISTRLHPRSRAWTPEVADGYIAVKDRNGVRIVADGLSYTNEIAFSPDGKWVYTNETYGQRVTRFPLLPGPALGPAERVLQLGGADLPDGICFDETGAAWISCIASNRVYRVTPDGLTELVIGDTDPKHASLVAEGIASQKLSHELMQTAGTSSLANVSSLAFGGVDRKTAYLGCLLDDKIRSFRAPTAGLPPAHWYRTLSH